MTPIAERLRALAAPALLMGLALALYANALGNDFVFDDLSLLRKNPAIRDPGLLWDALTRPGASSYRPVRTASFAIDFALSGDRTWAYHLLNALYHGLTAVLVHAVVGRLSRSRAAALCAALLFVAHPVHTESVAYISGRRDVLTGLFCLLGFYAYLRFREAGRWRWLGLAGVSLLLGLGVKEMAVVLPALVFAHDLILDRAALRRHAPIYAV
ncbi:MAG: glycosyltransferase family 39 protein, partial [Planctomycetota bacterium]